MEMLDLRTFSVAAAHEEIAHRTSLDIDRLQKGASFEISMCWAHEEDISSKFESAAHKLEQAKKLFDDGVADMFTAYSLQAEDDTQKEIIDKWIQNIGKF